MELVLALQGGARFAERVSAGDLRLLRQPGSAARMEGPGVGRSGREGDVAVMFSLDVVRLSVGDRLSVRLPRLRGVSSLRSGGAVLAEVAVRRLHAPAGEPVEVDAGTTPVTVLAAEAAVRVRFVRRDRTVLVDLDDRTLLADSERQRLQDGEQRIELATVQVSTATGLLQWDGTSSNRPWQRLRLTVGGSRGLPAPGDRLLADYDGDGAEDPGELLQAEGGLRLAAVTDRKPDGARQVHSVALVYLPGGERAFEFGASILVRIEVLHAGRAAPAPGHLADTSTATFLYEGVTRERRAYGIPATGHPSGDRAFLRLRCEESRPCHAFLECVEDGGGRHFGEVVPLIDGQAVRVLDAAAVEATAGIANPRIAWLSCTLHSNGDASVQVLVRSAASGTLTNMTYVAGPER